VAARLQRKGGHQPAQIVRSSGANPQAGAVEKARPDCVNAKGSRTRDGE